MANTEDTKSGTASTRCRNFTGAEDVLICLAWRYARSDDTIDIDQNTPTFWGKAHAYWLKYKDEDHPNRNPEALMQRFSRIKTSVIKFCGYLSKLEFLSNLTEAEKIQKAKQMYSEGESKGDITKNGSPKKEKFKYENCWNVLRHDPKWLEITNEKPKGLEMQVPHCNDIVPLDDDVDDESSPIYMEEVPIRKKFSKGEQTKRKRKFGYGSSPLLEKIDRFWKMNCENEAMLMEHDKKLDKLLELKKEKLELKKKKLEMDERRNDFDLMMVDVSSFTDPIQIQFFEKTRKNIMKKYVSSDERM